MMCAQFTEVCECDEFKQLSLAEVVDYVNSEDVDVPNADPLLDACIDWVNSDGKRNKLLVDLIQHIGLENCTAKFLDKISKKHKELFSTDILQMHLFEAYKTLAFNSK